MVKFSDLEKAESSAPPLRQKGGGRGRASSELSFRDLEKATSGIRPPGSPAPVEASLEDRKAIYDTATEYLENVLEAVRNRRRFALEPGEEIVRRIIGSQAPVDPLLIRAIYQENPSEYVVNHCVNVTIFAVKLAAALGLSNHEQEQIGLAALLHEVGMGVIPEALIYKAQKLDAKEYAVFRKRPEFAFKILKGFGQAYSFLADTVLQVHECLDGSGYPAGLSGEEIHRYAQIIGLVDLYEALIHSRPQRDKFLPFSAVKQIIKTGKRHYAKKHLKALLTTFSVFPLYSFVRLNSNAVGRVVQTYPEQPMRPQIEVVLDSQGRQVLTRHVVDLSENSILYIVDSVSEKDVAGMTEKPAEKTYPPAGAPLDYDLDAAGIAGGPYSDDDEQLQSEILQITEDDFEPLLPEDEGRNTEAGSILLAEPGTSGSVPGLSLGFPESRKRSWARRSKWALLALGMGLLAGVLIYRLASSEPPYTGDPGSKSIKILKPSGITGP